METNFIVYRIYFILYKSSNLKRNCFICRWPYCIVLKILNIIFQISFINFYSTKELLCLPVGSNIFVTTNRFLEISFNIDDNFMTVPIFSDTVVRQAFLLISSWNTNASSVARGSVAFRWRQPRANLISVRARNMFTWGFAYTRSAPKLKNMFISNFHTCLFIVFWKHIYLLLKYFKSIFIWTFKQYLKKNKTWISSLFITIQTNLIINEYLSASNNTIFTFAFIALSVERSLVIVNISTQLVVTTWRTWYHCLNYTLNSLYSCNIL